MDAALLEDPERNRDEDGVEGLDLTTFPFHLDATCPLRPEHVTTTIPTSTNETVRPRS